jgi:hypothetical protein
VEACVFVRLRVQNVIDWEGWHILVVHNHNKFDSRNARLMSKPCLKGLSRSCSSDHIAELWCSAVAQQGHTELNWAISRVLAAEIVIL